MLLCGASVVRFANGFVDPFKEQKDFVLAAIYIGQTGSVQWHTLYQNRNERKVCYRTEEFDFNKPVDRIKFALRLYNFYFAIGGESNAKSQIAAYKCQVNSHMPKLKSFYTGRGTKRDATNSGEGNARPRMRPRGDDPTELEAHGYIVEPDRIETEDGIFESLRKLPSNLLTVFRPSDPDTMLVAKKIRKESNELEILRLIHLIQPQSEHIITLLDSFHGQSSSWVILPKIMNNVEDWLWYDLNQFSPHLSPVCWGIIKGLAYLHEHHIAHRDIKPENLLVDHKFCLKIIDFDVAVQVRDDDEEVDDHCGTEGWVAPEIEMRSPTYSPIKADRWSCGAVILYIFGRLRQTDTMLETIAKKLKADTPEQRLSLVEWPKWSQPAPVVHVGTVMKRQWSRSSDEETLVELGNDDIGRKRSRIDKPYVDSLAIAVGIHHGGTDIQ
ncbi:Kinase-like protein [Pleurotus pulmonarius]